MKTETLSLTDLSKVRKK